MRKIAVAITLLLTVLIAVPASGNSVGSSVMEFEGTLTDAGGGVYTGTIDAVEGSWYVVGGGGEAVSTAGGFDVYGREGGCAFVQGYYGTGAWNCSGTDTYVLGYDTYDAHDAYPDNFGSAPPWGDFWNPDVPDYYNYELLLTDEGWALQFKEEYHGTPMSGVMDWANMYAAETDVGSYTGTVPADPDANDGDAADHGAGAGWWDMDWTWGSDAIPLQFAGFDVTVEEVTRGTYHVTLTPAALTEVWVDDDYTSATPGWGGTHFATIQDAVDIIDSGVVHVAAGTYVEQVHVTKDDVAIVGAGVGSTVIQSPVTLTDFFATGANNNYPVVFVDGATGVDLSDLTIDGNNEGDTNYRFVGLAFWNGDGSLVDGEVLNVMNSTFSGAQHGVGIYSYNDTGGPYAITLTDVLVDDYQKTAVALLGEGLTVALTRVVTRGQGPTAVTAQNGIQTGYGSGGTITDCEIYDNDYTGGTWTASGLLPNIGNPVVVTGTVTDGNQTSVYSYDADVSMVDCDVTGCTGSAVIAYASGAKLGGVSAPLMPSPFEENHQGRPSRIGMNFSADDCVFTGLDVVDEAGIYPYATGPLDVSITNSVINHWDYGVYAYEDGGTITMVLTGNSFTDNGSYAAYVSTAAEQDAKLNWWGDADGPTTAKAGGAVGGLLSYSPWYAAVPGTSPMPIGTNTSIQDAIDLASAGATISVSAGEYVEQLHITTNDLTIAGAGDDVVTIKSPATLPLFFGTNYPIVFIDGATGVDISGVTIDGDGQGNANYRFVGIAFWNAGGSLVESRVTGVMDTPFSGAQHGVAIYAYNDTGGPYAIAVSDVLVDDFQKNAFALSGDGLTVDLDDVVCIGQGPTTVTAQNGIQIGFGAGGTVDDCVVSDIYYTPTDWSATGALMYLGSSVAMTGVTAERCEVGVDFYDTDGSFVDGVVVDPYLDGLYVDASAAMRSDGRSIAVSPFVEDYVPGGRASHAVTVTDSRFFGEGVTDTWGVSTYAEGSASLTMTGCEVTNWDYGVVSYEAGGTSTLTANDNIIYDNMSYGYYTNATAVRAVQNAENNWWGDATGPYHPTANPLGLGNEVSDNVDFDPYMLGNIYCDLDPEYLTVAGPTKTVAVKYLGGGSGPMFGYSIKFSWDGSVVGTTTGDVNEGGLLKDIGGTFFFAADGVGDEIVVDCALLGSITGATDPGTLFTIDFTGLAVGTSAIDITVVNVRDQYNTPLSGFSPIDGTLIIDVVAPVITNVEIVNTTLSHTNDYIKDGDAATVTATVVDDDPAFGVGNIVADLTDLGGGAAVNPVSYLGNVATWNIGAVTCTPADGTVWVYVDATDGIGNPAGQGSDDIIADNTPPTAVTGMDAAPGHQKCDLSWTMGTDTYLDGVVVQRTDNAGDYPLYSAFKGAWPAVGPFYAADHSLGTNVYDGAATVAVDAVVDRNIYYYQAFCYDIARNYGAADVTGLSADLATNYWLGDVAAAVGFWGYNGFVNDADIDKLGGSYHQAPPGSPEDEMDVGPTVHPNYGRLGLPFPDNFVGFEDLMMFAMNYGVVAPRIVPLLSEPVEGQLALSLDEVGSDATGLVELALRLDGNVGDVKGISAVFELDGMELVSATLSDEMNSPAARTFLWAGDDQIDLAILGTGVAIGGSGEVARLTFQATSDECSVDFASASLRGVENELLDADVEGYDSTGDIPAVFKLAQNAPNPFNPMTTIAFNVPHESRVAIRVYDVTGRVVRTLVDGVTEPGRHAAVWDGRNDQGESCGSGVYFCVMETPEYRGSSKMMLLK